MKRRLNLAAGLLHDPDILLLDEPTVGVDPQSRNAIFDNLEALKRRGKALLYTTHYMEEAERLADRIVVIDHGKVIANDTLAGLQAAAGVRRRRAGDARDGISHADGKESARLMALTPLLAMIRKDLQLFFSDRRAVIMSFAVPIAIASFFGSIFSGPTRNSDRVRIAVGIVDLDGSAISKAVVSGAQADPNLRVLTPTEDDARDSRAAGQVTVAVVIPKGFGDAAGTAFFGNGEKPPLDVLFDPSRGVEVAMMRGILTEHVMQAVSKEMFGGEQGKAIVAQVLPQIAASTMPDEQKKALVEMLKSARQLLQRGPPRPRGNSGTRAGITMPYSVREQPMTSGENVAYNGYAHSCRRMGIQCLLFAAANLGIEILLERPERPVEAPAAAAPDLASHPARPQGDEHDDSSA
jgi:hypothetical protein